VLSAIRARTPFDYSVVVVISFVYAMPVFWLGQLLIFLLAAQFRFFPVQGLVTARAEYSGIQYVLDVIHHLALPAITLALAYLALIVRLTRTSMREVLVEDYIRTARAKGLAERVILWRHALRNALIPLVTVIALNLPRLLGGAVVIEAVFAWPGMGTLAITAVQGRDYPVIMAINLITAVLILVSNMLADVIYAVIDPRIKYA
jgi:peptide/nickel transport system permease protein